MQDVDKQIPATAPCMGHANLDKFPTVSPYIPQVGEWGLYRYCVAHIIALCGTYYCPVWHTFLL